MKTRKEHDFIGELEISNDVYYGVQTFRAVENFPMSGLTLKDYPFFVKAFAQVKKASALSNKEVGVLKAEIADAIVKACDRIINGEFLDQFVVDMVQGGAGTSTNMNANEVIANVALEILGHQKGEYQYCHPNDHVNLGQSTNDTYPSSIHVATYARLKDLLKAMNTLKNSLDKKADEFKDIIKMGRTELQDAVPTTLGNSFKAFASYIESDICKVEQAMEAMTHINMGSTAIGTGINCHPKYSKVYEKKISEITGAPFKIAKDLIQATQDTADFVFVTSVLKTAATRLAKMASDLRLMGSGPRCGLNEINLPKMQPGSSIMPGKVNPVIPEVVGIACYQVIGNDIAAMLCSERGEFELNAFEPGIAFAIFNSIGLLENSMIVLAEKCVDGITANPEVCLNAVLNSIGIVTAFNPHIGYEKSADISKTALVTGKSVGEIAVEKGYLTKEQVDKILNPKDMLNPHMGE